MKPTKPISRRQRALETMRAFMMPFDELFQRSLYSEEAETNKAFHLGTKEFTYVPTITGHVPAAIREQS